MYRLFAALNPIDPKPADPNIVNVPAEAIWIVFAAVTVLTVCGIIASVIITGSIKKRKEKELRQRIEDKERKTWRDY